MVQYKLILFATIVVLGLQTAGATASCGDYVSRKGGSSGKDLSNKATMGSLPIFDEHKPDQHNHPIPCTGPLCSEGPLPPIAPVSSSLVENDQWAWEMNLPREFFAIPNLFPLADEDIGAFRQSSEIFHPPRSLTY